MPTKIEKDAVSGQDTTGHEWDGLKELNTPLPKWWLYTFAATVVWALGFMRVLSVGPDGTRLLPRRARLFRTPDAMARMKAVEAQRCGLHGQIAAMPIAAIQQNPQLQAMALTAGRIAFANNCQPCHGAGGAGRLGYPSLGDDVWLWGGKLADIQQTITHGIRSGDPDDAQLARCRISAATGMLKPREIQRSPTTS